MAAYPPIDWNIALQMGNSWYDRMAKTMREPIGLERRKHVAQIVHEYFEASKESKDWQKFAEAARGTSPKQALAERAGLIAVVMLLPAIGPFCDAEDRAAMQIELSQLGFALAAYRADNGSYPNNLADLRTQYISEIPNDLFVAQQLHYKRVGDGYLLYSVGVNGIDDGGKGYTDRLKDETWDDIVIRVPVNEK